ncbi:MAG: helicase-associated domain-containing protein [Chloroflexi bacterium]|nr:helicase-associated domain-containing protein [Chloroflexota bacterium]
MKLRSLLEQSSLGELHRVFQQHGAADSVALSRAELVHELAARLTEPGYLGAWLERLDANARTVLRSIVADGGQTRGFVLERRVRQVLGSETPERTVRAEIDRLLSTGLVFRGFQAFGPERGEVFVMPEELLPLLPARVEATADIRPRVSAPERVLACSPVFALFALASFVRRWRLRDARQSSNAGQLAALDHETEHLVAELPGRAARERWTLLAHLAVHLGIFTREDGALDHTEELPGWLGDGDSGHRRLWETYVRAAQWNDLERAGSGKERYAGRVNESLAARAQVLDVLQRLPGVAWLEPEEVVRAVREQAPDFLREGFDVSTSRLLDLLTGEVLAGSSSWDKLEGEVVRYLLSGPLYWLGVVEWGATGEAPDRLRVSELVVGLLVGAEAAAVVSPCEPLELRDDRRIVASTQAELAILWQLEPYLVLEDRGPPSVYHLSRLSLARGLEAGGSVQDLHRLLERGAGGALPEAFSGALDRWSTRVGRLRIRPAVLLTSETAEELDVLLERADLATILKHRIGPRAVSVPAGRAQELADLLERHGHLPELDASLRLMAGRRAYAGLVDQRVLETLLYALRAMRTIDPTLLDGLVEVEALSRRLETALGPIAASLIRKRAAAAGRRAKRQLPRGRVGRRKPGAEPD